MYHCWIRGHSTIALRLNALFDNPEKILTNTIDGFRSVISAYHNPIGGVSIGSNARVSDLLWGTFNNRPQQPKHTFILDVKRITDFLITLKCDKDFALKNVTVKLTVVLTLALAELLGLQKFLCLTQVIRLSFLRDIILILVNTQRQVRKSNWQIR